MEKRLCEICEIQAGGTPSRSNNEYWLGGGIPWVKISDIKGKYIDSTEEYITQLGLDNSSAKVFPKGTILYTIFATLGETGILSIDAATNQAIAGLRIVDEEVIPEYLYFFLCSLKDYVNNIGRGVAQNNINLGILRNLTISIPTKETQESIARKLNKVEELIALRKKQLQKLDDLVKARFVEMFGDPLSGTDKWPIHIVGDVADSVDPQPSHRTPPVDEAGIPYVSIKDCDYKTGIIDFENARKVGRNVLEEHLQRYELHDGDFIIGKIGTIGNPIFVPARKDYTLSANIVLIQPDKNRVSPYFLKYSFMSAYMDRQFEEAKNSTSQTAFGIQKVRAIKVMNPPIDIQYQFEAFAKQVDKSKLSIQQGLEKLETLKKSLMQQYFG